MEKFIRKIENEKNIDANLSLENIKRTREFVSKFALFLEENELLRKDFEGLRKEGFLGNGGAGTVFALNKDICFKVMDNRPKADNYSSYDDEALTAKTINGLKTENVKTPEFFAYYRTEHNREILMERIHGFSLQNIFNGDAKFPEKFLERYYNEDGFDYDSFEDDLNEFLDNMHDKGVVHGDLASRNIMINIDGKIVVIDTGRSKFINHLSSDEALKLKEKDDDGVQEIINDFKDFFAKNNLSGNEQNAIVHYNLDIEDEIIEVEIFSDSILNIVKEFINEKNKISDLTEVVNGLYISPKKEDLILGLKSIDYSGNKYFIGFKKEEE